MTARGSVTVAHEPHKLEAAGSIPAPATAIMTQPYEHFIFERYHFDGSAKKLTLEYSLDSKVHFTEEVFFDFDLTADLPAAPLEAAFFGTFIMAGIGYYKTYVPQGIVLRSGNLSAGQKAFFEKIYSNGLGQFFYENNLDPNTPITFPTNDTAPAVAAEPLPQLAGSIVPVGGGKDSITTVEILKSEGEEFESWNIGAYPFFEGMLKEMGGSHLRTRRVLSPNLFELNKQGALNGHVPITALESFLAVCAALLRGKKTVIFSNEASANEGNLEYKGRTINHQYSKTLEFEKDFQAYVYNYISPSLTYFSFLRPLKELRIAEIFCKNFFDNYKGNFSSCNRNFHIGSDHERFFWCGECPKCAFIFLAFSPFLPKDKLLGIFGGKNLFADAALTPTFRQIMGISGNKPMECVGEISEARQAVVLARATGQWPELTAFEFPEPPTDYANFGAHIMPEHFEKILKHFIDTHI